jgi:hypothetical protein
MVGAAQNKMMTAERKLGTKIHLCGCQHSHPNSFKSFTKVEAAHYIGPHKFLEGGSCLDCMLAVGKTKSNSHRQEAMLFYCDQSIKGFCTPYDDLWKGKLTSDLVLCPDCESRQGLTL